MSKEARECRMMGPGEVCEALGIASGNLPKVKDLPSPHQELAGGRIWKERDILPFAEKYRRRTKRPPLATKGTA